MTVNLSNERDEPSLLYVGFALEVADDATQAQLTDYMPQLRSQLLTLVSGQNSTQLITPQGKAALAARILDALKQPLAPQQPAPALLRVLYTDFIVQ
jgi:flagellar protein FliL